MQSPLRRVVPSPPLSNAHLDYLLAQVADAVQLTATQYDKAKAHYEAVGAWLAASGSPLALFQPTIYPQGSMRLGTTVKPRGAVEYDLDLVCQVRRGAWTAMDLYHAVHDRLHDHETYRSKLKKKKRCLCLDYAGEFHLDIIPAVADPSRGPNCVVIPDRKLTDWTPSNPRGYADWFEKQSIVLMERIAKAAAEPLPANQPASQKLPLVLAVQLMKRARDVVFDGADEAPRSVILTTLAGEHYPGGPCVVTAIVEVARAIQQRVRAATPGALKVVNPTNPDENFCDGMTADRHEALESFAKELEGRVLELTQLHGERLYAALEKLFDRPTGEGEKPAAAALRRYAELLKSRRDSGTLTSSAAGLGVVAPVTGIRVPRHTYFGD
jgi:hypothetical protein